ncbi:GLPGLI family protein [Hymenobacter lutimineralis]|uniref:GLPGLI family protein n=1 Tax=Hymenobacter lutimineralis TaxID=2606448 RepID=A0A5D6UXT0_9BACT|nr:GLPGLI family protein [Hymenobacter lutimineralis]TYZ07797.1 GLPGLI family protein [Hymenobacter lutimineralis]
MRLLLVLLCFLAAGAAWPFAQPACAQAPRFSVTYQQQFSGEPQPTATLVVNGSSTLYYYNRTAGEAARELQQTNETNYTLAVTDAEGTCVYRDAATGRLLARELEISTQQFVLIADTVPRLNWKLGTATRQIGQYQAQQATTTFRGRHYEAWFTPEIPVSAGPWKLGGLPGLILEARDATGQVAFAALRVSQPAGVATPVLPPTQGRRYGSWAEYQAASQAAAERLAKFMQAQAPGISVKISRGEALELAP